MRLGSHCGPFPAAARLHQVRGPADLLVVERRQLTGVARGAQHEGPQLFGVVPAAGQRGHHRQRLFPVPQVVARRLARLARVAPDAQQVIHGLEGQAQVAAEVAQRTYRGVGGGGQDGADRRRATQQGARLGLRHGHAFLDADIAALLEGDVVGLSGDHLGGGRAERCGGGRAGGR